jgi:hypothetical protein
MRRNPVVLCAVILGVGMGSIYLYQSPKESWPKPSVVQPSDSVGSSDSGVQRKPDPKHSRSLMNGGSTKGFEKDVLTRKIDLRQELSGSLRDAELGAPAAQYRVAVLLRDCRNARVEVTDLNRLRDQGIDEATIEAIQLRVQECSAVNDLIRGDIKIISSQWFEAALRQKYPVAIAEDLVLSEAMVTSDELDGALRAALMSAGTDPLLRSEAFLYVLAAMGKRSASTGVEADATVRDAWTLLHCREVWDCDQDATQRALEAESTPANMKIAVDLAGNLDAALKAGNFESVRLN